VLAVCDQEIAEGGEIDDEEGDGSSMVKMIPAGVNNGLRPG